MVSFDDRGDRRRQEFICFDTLSFMLRGRHRMHRWMVAVFDERDALPLLIMRLVAIIDMAHPDDEPALPD